MSRRAFPSFVLAVLFAATAVNFASADTPDPGDDIPPSEVPAKAHSNFNDLRAKYPKLGAVVDKTETEFDQKIVGVLKHNVSQGDLTFINKVADHYLKVADKYAAIVNNSSLTDDQKNQQINQLMKDSDQRMNALQAEARNNKSVHADVVSAVGGNQPDSGKTWGQSDNGKTDDRGAKGQGDQDVATIAGVVKKAVHDAFVQNGGSGGNAPGAPNLGNVIHDPVDPNDASSEITAARDNLLKGNLPDALSDANKAVDAGGGAPALALRGGVELDQNHFATAHEDAQQALQLDPANKEALAVSHFSEGRADGMAVGGPGSADGKAGSGGGSGSGGSEAGAYGSAGSAESSAGSFGGAGGAAANAAQARLASMQAQKAAKDALSLGDLSAAKGFVNRALAQDPKNAELLDLRAQISARMRDYAGAIADAKAGLALSPKNAALLRTLGYAQLRSKDYKGALATANEMIELDPNDAYAYALRAHAYGSMGDRDAMMSDLKRAAELDPSFASALAQAREVKAPSDDDILFLFPGEEAPGGSAAGGTSSGGRNRRFGLLVGVAALGGLLLALGLLHTVLAPLKDQVSSVFTRIARTGPTLGAVADVETAEPASVGGLLSGSIRGQYDVLRQIGAGGMGLVFEGTDRSLGRRVAIKKMRDELRSDARERARFVAEAKTVAALHHPNIVDIYAIAEDGSDVYLVFEYVDGKTVNDLLQARGRLEPDQAVKVARAAADALEYAHSRGVIHRDMKPSNVMIDASGRVKVMDFGIARLAKDAMTRYSVTNTVVGTPPYMAPEAEQGQVRRESDAYSLAVCAYEMLTGRLPFAGTGGGMLLNKINMSYVAPSRAIAGLPERLDEVFEKAFQADPERRYRTPKEFADALDPSLSSAARAL